MSGGKNPQLFRHIVRHVRAIVGVVALVRLYFDDSASDCTRWQKVRATNG
jgi:hypothetical protein